MYEYLKHNLHNILMLEMCMIINSKRFCYRFYPGVPDALKFASSKIYIVTTKQVSSSTTNLERTVERSDFGDFRKFTAYILISLAYSRHAFLF